MHRIHDPELDTLDAVFPTDVVIEGAQAHHAASVKRLQPGDEIEIFDGAGNVASAVVKLVKARSLTLTVNQVRVVPPPTVDLAIASPVPKGQRPEWLIDQLSQIGAARWQPVITRRSVVNPQVGRVEKWRQVTAVESARQSGRAHLLRIADPVSLDQLIRDSQGPECQLRLADPDGQPQWRLEPDQVTRLVVIVGPEGGLTDDERNLVLEHGGRSVSLGPHTLRTETACVVAAAQAIAVIRRQIPNG